MLYMKKVLSVGQVQDGAGIFAEALRSRNIELPTTSVPRPAFSLVLEQAVALGLPVSSSTLVLQPASTHFLAKFSGLRVVAQFRHGQNVVQAPGIILDGARGVAVLTAAKPMFDNLTHSLLENEYLTQKPGIVSHDAPVDRLLGGHALVAATKVALGSPHDLVHRLDRGNFGSNFSAGGRRDIAVGHDTYSVRTAVLNFGTAALATMEAYQLAPQVDLSGIGLSSDEMNIATTLAATMTKSTVPVPAVVEANLRAMEGL